MRFKIIMIVLALTGCSATNPRLLSANQQCGLAPNIWHQVEAPASRQQLLDLLEQVSNGPVHEYFVSTDSEQEVWFEDSNQNLQACIYDPNEIACYRGELKTVTFMKEGSSWRAGPVGKHICYDRSAHNMPLKKDAQ